MRRHPDDDRGALSRAWSAEDAADRYERGRPGWPRELLRALPLPDGPKLDLAAGTGKLTRLLDPPVYAVDPSEAMLARLRHAAPHAEALAGDAEAIPLPDEAVDSVFVAEAFHWFANDAAVGEIARVLRPGGLLVLLWNVPLELPPLDFELPPRTFSAWQTRDSGVWREPLRARFTVPRRVTAEHELRLDAAGWRAHVGSWSSVTLLPDDERRAALDRLGDEDVVIPYRAEAWWCRRDP
ncbi:MAG TPA: class I SAM-dependent methyltransferase [Solirubrobacteraceae bacterium]